MTAPAAPAPEAHRFAAAALATPHYLATHAGAAVLREGGNAMDAAIAANLVLGVVAPYTCGPGGSAPWPRASSPARPTTTASRC